MDERFVPCILSGPFFSASAKFETPSTLLASGNFYRYRDPVGKWQYLRNRFYLPQISGG